jgi:hypothetical protein
MLPEFSATPEVIAMLAGALLSLAFSYIPGLSGKFGALLPEYKRGIMALLMVIVGAAAFGLSCAGILPGMACDQPSVIRLVWVVILAINANQTMWLISKPPTHETVGTDDTARWREII